jgi:phosphatidylinositol alpha-1,6-mannosyltransferase
MNDWLLVCLNFPPQVGGIQTFLAELARRVDGIRVLAPRQVGSDAFDASLPCPVQRVRAAGAWAAVAPLALALMRALRHHPGAGVLLGHPKLAPLAPLVQHWFGRPAAVFTFGMDVTSGRFKALERAGLKRAWRVITISRYTQHLLENLGISPDRIRLVAPGVAPVSLPPPRPPSGRPVLLTVGRMELSEGYKGHDRVLDALPHVLVEFPDLEYVVVGGGSARERLSAMVRERGLERTVRFAGEVPQEKLSEFYSNCDIFVMPSWVIRSGCEELFEGFGIAYLEAAVHGRPVVAGRAGGAVDAVVDQETGVLVDPEDPRAIADALLSLLRDPARRAAMGERGRARALAAHSWESTALALLKVLREAGG